MPANVAVRLWLPADRSTVGLAVPAELSATVVTVTALPLNSSLMATVPPATGVPPEVTAMVRGCEHVLRVPAVSVVVVAIGAGAASAGMASAIINPATKSSRRLRRFMPLTRTFQI